MPFVRVYPHASFRLLALPFVFAAAIAASLASAVSASSITFSLIPGPGGPGTFELTAQTSIGDNFGLDYYAVTIAGAATIQHASVSPMGSDLDSGLNYGFSFARSADNVAVVSAAQDSVGGGVPVYGIGQTAGDLKSLLPTGDAFATGKSNSLGLYGAPVVLATGTYADNIMPTIVTNALTGFVFTSQGTAGKFGSFAAPSNFVINQLDGSSISVVDPLARPVVPQTPVDPTPTTPPLVTPPEATPPPAFEPPTTTPPPMTKDPPPAAQDPATPPDSEGGTYGGIPVSVDPQYLVHWGSRQSPPDEFPTVVFVDQPDGTQAVITYNPTIMIPYDSMPALVLNNSYRMTEFDAPSGSQPILTAAAFTSTGTATAGLHSALMSAASDTAAPEPASLSLLALAGAGYSLGRRAARSAAYAKSS